MCGVQTGQSAIPTLPSEQRLPLVQSKTLDDGNIHVQNKHASVVHLFSLNNFSSLQPPFYCPRYYFLAHTIFTSIRPIDDIETLPTSATTRVRTHCRSTCADNDLNCTRRGREQEIWLRLRNPHGCGPTLCFNPQTTRCCPTVLRWTLRR